VVHATADIFGQKRCRDRRLTSAWSGQDVLDLVGYHSGFDERRNWSRREETIASGAIRAQTCRRRRRRCEVQPKFTLEQGIE